MITLFKFFLRRLRNSAREIGLSKMLLFISFGFLLLGALTFVFIKLFAFISKQPEFPDVLKLFLSEKILLMTFMTIFLMLIISSLTSTLNIFFLSRDLRLLFATPLSNRSIFTWKTLESLLNSSLLVVLFSLPVLIAYAYYFAPSLTQILQIALSFMLFILGGALLGITLGMVIPLTVSLRKLQPILSIITIILISSLVIFLRLLKPEQFGNPEIIGNIVQYISGFNHRAFTYFPFSWTAGSLTATANGDHTRFFQQTLALGIFAGVFLMLLLVFQARFFKSLYDKLNRGNGFRYSPGWSRSRPGISWLPLWRKEIRAFIRTPEQWSQVLIILAIIVVFIVNIKTIPLPHPSVKNLIAYLNLGILTFIIAGLNSRFTFTSLPMEKPAIVHLMVSPMNRKSLYHFKILFFLVPMMILGFLLFVLSNILLKVDPIIQLTGFLYLSCGITFQTLFALYMSLKVKTSHQISSQHLIVTKPGILYMFYCIAYIVISMIFFIRPLYLYYISTFRQDPVPYMTIGLWFTGFLLGNLLLIHFTYRRGRNQWLRSEYT